MEPNLSSMTPMELSWLYQHGDYQVKALVTKYQTLMQIQANR